ncbi:hypothetical protein AMAG_08454 [Allomyces macrogynus ATCC 38327]|uniref:Uncharacterized protein n=1 Tax=Allomyces macrogynus (strain ATCC 38327) TaxID=578462 RepID=A0A0L0SLQ4_ALLM3|nr:hypothetical protein AMAG_08454 [Allomyces macrogynus ATCC 38327]|eukprot:KNE63315.1 hypothetical protein AMAG_08454 [Allomyces macrogynus ATCC 38327]
MTRHEPDWRQLSRDACKLIASSSCPDRDLRSTWSESMNAAVTNFTQPEDPGDYDHCPPGWTQLREDMERAIRIGLVAAMSHGDMGLAVELVLAGRSARVSNAHVEAVAQMMVHGTPSWVSTGHKVAWPSALIMLAFHALLHREPDPARQVAILAVLVRVSAVGNANYAVCYLEQLTDTLREMDPRAVLPASIQRAAENLTTFVADVAQGRIHGLSRRDAEHHAGWGDAANEFCALAAGIFGDRNDHVE